MGQNGTTPTPLHTINQLITNNHDNKRFIFSLLEIFNQQYTQEHLNTFLAGPISIPITCNTSSWHGGRVRLNTVAYGRAMMTTGWPDIIMGDKLT
jgi:hypothetical protein